MLNISSEEEEETIDLGYGKDDPDDPAMHLIDRETEEHDADAELQSHIRDDVNTFTYPPPLCCCSAAIRSSITSKKKIGMTLEFLP